MSLKSVFAVARATLDVIGCGDRHQDPANRHPENLLHVVPACFAHSAFAVKEARQRHHDSLFQSMTMTMFTRPGRLSLSLCAKP